MTADGGKLEGLTRLGRAWLDELNLLHRLKDDATEDERRELISKANEAVATVEAQFRRMGDAGQLKASTAVFKAYKKRRLALGLPPPSWNEFNMARKEKAVRLYAREQAFRNRWNL